MSIWNVPNVERNTRKHTNKFLDPLIRGITLAAIDEKKMWLQLILIQTIPLLLSLVRDPDECKENGGGLNQTGFNLTYSARRNKVMYLRLLMLNQYYWSISKNIVR